MGVFARVCVHGFPFPLFLPCSHGCAFTGSHCIAGGGGAGWRPRRLSRVVVSRGSWVPGFSPRSFRACRTKRKARPVLSCSCFWFSLVPLVPLVLGSNRWLQHGAVTGSSPTVPVRSQCLQHLCGYRFGSLVLFPSGAGVKLRGPWFKSAEQPGVLADWRRTGRGGYTRPGMEKGMQARNPASQAPLPPRRQT